MIKELQYPTLLREFIAVSGQANLQARRFVKRCEVLDATPDKLFDEQLVKLSQSQAAHKLAEHWLYFDDAARSLIEHGEEQIASTKAMLLAMEPLFAREDLTEELSDLAYPISEELVKLKSIRSRVAQLTPVHRRVQLHLTSLSQVYGYGPRALTPTVEICDTVNRLFYSPLAKARDAFFADTSVAKLRDYLATAEELAGKEHPLLMNVDVTAERFDEAARRAEAVEAELVRDELMFELLEAER